MRRGGLAAALAVALLVQGCARCSGAGGPADAGTLTPAVDAGGVTRLPPPKASVDLRTAVLLTYPEYRDTALLDARGTLTRAFPGTDAATRQRALQEMKYQPAEDGGWALTSFHVTEVGAESLAVTIAFDPEQLAHLYVSATALNSAELGLYLPRTLPLGAEHFDFDVRYATAPKRARELIQQATSLLVKNGQWRLSEGSLVLPPLDTTQEDRVALTGPSGGVISFERVGGRVHAQYALDTR
ncbi:MAG: hypothetical protein U0228_23825 [Myxococcaceae bacterium]